MQDSSRTLTQWAVAVLVATGGGAIHEAGTGGGAILEAGTSGGAIHEARTGEAAGATVMRTSLQTAETCTTYA